MPVVERFTEQRMLCRLGDIGCQAVAGGIAIVVVRASGAAESVGLALAFLGSKFGLDKMCTGNWGLHALTGA